MLATCSSGPLIDHALINALVSVDAAVTQKWPMRPLLVYAVPLDVRQHNLFLIDGSFCNHYAVRAADKALPPKLNSVSPCRCFVADAIWHCDVAAICDRVTALDRFPGRMLRRAKLFLFRRVPANRRWIKDNLGSAQRRETRCLWIPLVPANADADFAPRCLPSLKSHFPAHELKPSITHRILPITHLP